MQQHKQQRQRQRDWLVQDRYFSVDMSSLVAVLALAGASVVGALQPAVLAVPGSKTVLLGRAEIAASIDASLRKATQAAMQAQALTKQVKQQSDANIAAAPLVEAEVGMAEEAAITAKEQDDAASTLLKESTAAVNKAALAQARAYFGRVRKIGSEQAQYGMAKTKAATEVDDAAVAKASTEAAMPYHAMLLRGQKAMFEYVQRAQAMASASNTLKAESETLATAANNYQSKGQTAEANQLMVTAHAEFRQAESMQAEAERLREAGQELQIALPAYKEAEQAAAASAAAVVQAQAGGSAEAAAGPWPPY